VWLTAAQGTRYASNAWASLMAAIALAESNGDPLATNPNDDFGRQTSWGLWQISDGTHASVSRNWANPEVNAQLAIEKLNTPKGLGNWGTYTSGAYKAYLNDKTTPAPVGSIPAIGGTAAQAPAQLTAAEQAQATSDKTDCLVGFDKNLGVKIGPVPIIAGPTIDLCFLSKGNARAILGALVMVSGSGVMLAGLAVLIATTTGLGPGPLRKLSSATQAVAGKAGLTGA
jgi:hypothetical protein